MKKLKRKAYTVLCIALAVILLTPYFFNGVLLGFYSDFAQTTTGLGTGSINPVIENLRLETNNVEKAEEELQQSSNFLRVNKSVIVSFTLRNAGRSDIKYTLDIQIASAEDLREAGKFLVYPYEYSDDEIYQNIKSGNFSGAIIGAGVSDEKEIQLLEGINSGISETVNSGFLKSTGEEDESEPNTRNEFAADYRFKLFFYEDADVASSPEKYHNKNVGVNLVARAVLAERATDWVKTAIKSFSVISVIDTAYPDIKEISAPKTYFITQAQAVDLSSYAVATDVFDGDITKNIIISSSPQFDAQKAGVYNITYSVTNSIGNAAAPLHITVVVWDFAKITSGYYHTLALTSHGRIYTWGYNAYGQLGDGTYTDKSTPTRLESLEHIVDVAAGVGCSYALSADGQVYSWGRNENGRLGDNTTTAKNKPIKVAQPDGVKFVQISARFATAGGVTAEGDVYTWGYGGYGTAGTGKTADIHVPAKIDLSNIAQAELGYYNGVAVTKDGKVYTWGRNTYGQLGTGAAASTGTNPIAPVSYFDGEDIKIKQASVGYYHMTAVSDDGKLFTWGYGNEGRLGNGATSNYNVPQPVDFAVPVKKALAGYYHTGVLTSSGTAYFFGQNAYGKHGSGNTTNHLTPYELTSVANVTDISLALDSSFVLSSFTDVYGMGYGGTGVLGTGNNSNSNVAVKWAFTPPKPY